MEAIKQELVEAGVIGRVVDDFNPHIQLTLFYGDKPISLGQELSLDNVQHFPNRIRYDYVPDRFGFRDFFTNPTLITLIMMNPDSPSGEYLHWLATDFLTAGDNEGDLIAHWRNLVEYEPPRSMGFRMIVFTLFKPKEPPNYVPNSPENFSTRNFAFINALGPPVGAAFFKIKNEYENTQVDFKNEDEDDTQTDFKSEDEEETQTDFKNENEEETQTDLKNEDEKETRTHVDESPTCSTTRTRTYVKAEENEDESTSKRKRFRKF